ncbi:MAG: NAD-dependent epimerase/dehydratase family protein [Phycisphaerales bacterium]|nr:NAD-dependent epimerase/dehydratase family protein [Phycisphaerales bacterium]
MNCIIVGGGGFVGRHLGNHLVAQGHRVRGIDAGLVHHEVETRFPVDVADVIVDAPVVEPETEAVFYLAQSPHYRAFPRHGAHLFGVNVIGALRWAEAAIDAGVKAFIYASTGSIYAPGFEPMSEDRPVRRDHAYALSKISAEEALAILPGPMAVIRARLFGAFGPGQATMLVPGVTGRVQRGEPVTVERNPLDQSDHGGLRISLTYVDDVARCLAGLAARALDGRDVPRVINVAADEPVSVRRLATGIGAVLGVDPVIEAADRARESDYIADVGRLRALLAPTFTPLDVALRLTLASHA